MQAVRCKGNPHMHSLHVVSDSRLLWAVDELRRQQAGPDGAPRSMRPLLDPSFRHSLKDQGKASMGRTLGADAFKTAVKKLKDMPDSPLKCKKQNKHIKARAKAHENLAYFAQFCAVMFACTDLGEPLSSYLFSQSDVVAVYVLRNEWGLCVHRRQRTFAHRDR